MNSGAVVVLSDNAEFARSLVARWGAERQVPGFTVLGRKMWTGAAAASCDVVVAGPADGDWLDVLCAIDSGGTPLLCLAADRKLARKLREALPRSAVLMLCDDCIEAAVVCGSELLRRVEIARRAAAAEKAARDAERHAVLGRYMLEQRHGINNALTSVLGNAELMLLEPGALAGEAPDQVRTVRDMALRIHEIVQRFSSLEAEMSVGETPSQSETRGKSRPATNSR